MGLGEKLMKRMSPWGLVTEDTPPISYEICSLPMITVLSSVTNPQGDILFINFSPRILSILRHMYGISYNLLFHPVITSGVLDSIIHQLMKSFRSSYSVLNDLYNTFSCLFLKGPKPQVIICLVV